MSENIKSVSVITKKSSKKQLQLALKSEIEKIDEKLASIGLPPNIVYNVGTINNHETLQNTINISAHTDINLLYRFHTYYSIMYDNILITSKKLTGIANTEIRNINNVLIRDIISNIELRIKVLSNQELINALNSAKQKLSPFLDEESRLYNTMKEVNSLYKDIINKKS